MGSQFGRSSLRNPVKCEPVRVEAATRLADKLTQSILAKAFRVELVATEAELARCEGRGCEPAPALLERIHAERAKLASIKTAKTRAGRPKAREE